MSDNPFVIPVPQGTTEIDLGPILKPLLWALKGKMKVGDGRKHSWGSRKSTSDFAPDEMGELLAYAQNSYEYNQLIRKLTKPTLISYLNANDWVDEDDRGYSFVRTRDKGRSLFDRTGGTLRLQGEHKKLSTYSADDIVNTLAHNDGKTKLEMIREILAHDNVLDRIVNELSQET